MYNQLRKDDFETSTIEILKEQNKKSKTILEKFEDSQISQIFLFFDYDGHARDNVTSRHTELQELLEYFDNETEDGKLYISYPMAESLKDFTENDVCFRNCTIDISLGKKYKSTVADISHYNYPNLFEIDDWYYISALTLCKSNCILFDLYDYPEFFKYLEYFTQVEIYTKQNSKYIAKHNKIARLSAY